MAHCIVWQTLASHTTQGLQPQKCGSTYVLLSKPSQSNNHYTPYSTGLYGEAEKKFDTSTSLEQTMDDLD